MQLGGALYPAPAAAVPPQPASGGGGTSSALLNALMQNNGMNANSMSGAWGQIPLSTIAALASKNKEPGQGLFGLGGPFGSGGYFDNLFGGGYLGTAGTGAPADQFSEATAAGFSPFEESP